MPKINSLLIIAVALAWPLGTAAQEAVDLDVINRIRDEGFNRPQVTTTLQHLTDVIGPRLTGSPQLRAANDWTLGKFKEWGLVNGHLEAFEFGRGWSFSRASVHMLSPHAVPLSVVPKAWTPGTDGAVQGQMMVVEIDTAEDFERYRGKLQGKIVLLDEPGELKEPSNDIFKRFDDKELADMSTFKIPDGKVSERRLIFRRSWLFGKTLYDFLAEEGILAAINISRRSAGLIEATGYTYRPGDAPAFPVLVMASEHYNRLVRLSESGLDVELEIDISARFYDDDPMAYNTIAEIPGDGGDPELVMVGAHLDSWHGGTGAVDNGAGSAVIMEAMRILAAIGVKPNRTIRIALWSGEEQGLLGSRAYVAEHFASRPEPADPKIRELPEFLRFEKTWPISLRPDHKRLSVYFNIDNGSGKIRGIYAEQNSAAKPIFQSWFGPFRDLGVKIETLRQTGGTDHMSFDAVGLPGFQFVQDRLDYRSRLHHSNIDAYDHIRPEDLKQASVILASFLFHAATREQMIPRKPMPTEPSAGEKERRAKARAKMLKSKERKHKRESYWEDD